MGFGRCRKAEHINFLNVCTKTPTVFVVILHTVVIFTEGDLSIALTIEDSYSNVLICLDFNDVTDRGEIK